MLLLDSAAARVVAVLVEKDRTTPDSYPLTTNSLVAACNQKTSRDPVTSLTVSEVDAALLDLRQRGMARTLRATGERTFKHRHTLDEALGLDDKELTCLALLMLRGAQSPGELRTRSERYASFSDLAAVEAVLGRLAGRDEPLVENTGRGPGQSQDRWIELVSEASTTRSPVGAESPATAASRPAPVGRAPGDVESLRREVAELRGMVDEIRRELGMAHPDGEPSPGLTQPEAEPPA